MYAILGEDESDTEMLKVLIRKIHADDSVRVKCKGFSGCKEMLRKGASYFKSFKDLGCKYFIVAYDADRESPVARRQEALEKVVHAAQVTHHCVLVPVQEIEAWILADLPAIKRSNVCPGWNPEDEFSNPENVADPKERLEKLSRNAKQHSRYNHVSHNPRVASYLDLDVVAQKCPSFRPLHDFVNRVKSGTI